MLGCPDTDPTNFVELNKPWDAVERQVDAAKRAITRLLTETIDTDALDAENAEKAKDAEDAE